MQKSQPLGEIGKAVRNLLLFYHQVVEFVHTHGDNRKGTKKKNIAATNLFNM